MRAVSRAIARAKSYIEGGPSLSTSTTYVCTTVYFLCFYLRVGAPSAAAASDWLATQ